MSAEQITPLGLNAALAFLEDQPLRPVRGSIWGRVRPAIPRRLVQYWDHDPPAEITRLLAHNAEICARMGLAHIIYTDATAQSFLKQWHDPNMLDVYMQAPHAAIRSDLFRYAELAVNGGWYLDADMALRATSPHIWSTQAQAVVFKWVHPDRRNICNWFFGTSAGNPLMEHIRLRAAANIMHWTASGASGRDMTRNALSVAGPGLFTCAIAESLRATPKAAQIATVDQAYRIVMNGPEYLGRPLEYKSTARHWLKAGN